MMTVPVKERDRFKAGVIPVLEPGVGVVALELLPDDVAKPSCCIRQVCF